MKIIDTQVHIWAASTPERPWMEGMEKRAHREQPISAEMVLQAMGEAGVTHAILVPPSLDGDRNDLALAAAQKYPDKLAVMGRLLIDKPGAPARLERWKDDQGMLGMRLTFHRDNDRPLITNGAADWVWPVAQRLDIPVMVHAPERIAEVGEIARKYPRLRLIVDHMGFARETMDGEAKAAVDRLLTLAPLPNVSVKVSAMPCFSTEPYPFRNLHEPIKRTIDGFGVGRCFWGTDYSRLEGICTYRQAVTMFTEELGLSASDLEAVMGESFARAMGWPQ
jgi:L-fuconolactonase